MNICMYSRFILGKTNGIQKKGVKEEVGELFLT